MPEDKELIRRALLGDQQVQKECAEKGIVLPCWRCGGESEIQELHTGGKPIYAVTCKKTYCGAYGCACSTQQKAIEYWNTRPAPPVGRCKDCRWYEYGKAWYPYCNHPDGLVNSVKTTDFCSYFEPKEDYNGLENAVQR